jgi:hypothetical protein
MIEYKHSAWADFFVPFKNKGVSMKSYRCLVVVAAAVLLAACGGGETADSVTVSTSAALPMSFATAVSVTDEVQTPAPTNGEILDSLIIPSGLFVNSNSEGTVKAAPGQPQVTLISFSRTEKFIENYGFSNQPVNQLVFANRSDTNIQDVLDAWDVHLKYGYQDMSPTIWYYVETWKTDKGSGLTVTFYGGWYGEVPNIGVGMPFRLEATIKYLKWAMYIQ